MGRGRVGERERERDFRCGGVAQEGTPNQRRTVFAPVTSSMQNPDVTFYGKILIVTHIIS